MIQTSSCFLFFCFFFSVVFLPLPVSSVLQRCVLGLRHVPGDVMVEVGGCYRCSEAKLSLQ